LTYQDAWVKLYQRYIQVKINMTQTISTRFYFAPFYFGFRKPDAVGGA
jgi:hypothetical protein